WSRDSSGSPARAVLEGGAAPSVFVAPRSTSKDGLERNAPARLSLRHAARHHASASPNSDCIRCAVPFRGESNQHAATPKLACAGLPTRSEEHTSELQSQSNLVCRLLL